MIGVLRADYIIFKDIHERLTSLTAFEVRKVYISTYIFISASSIVNTSIDLDSATFSLDITGVLLIFSGFGWCTYAAQVMSKRT